MKKIIGIIGVVAFAMTMFFNIDTNVSSDINLASLAKINTANAEVPDLDSPIWVVKVIVGWPSNQLECTTGGTYVCKVEF